MEFHGQENQPRREEVSPAKIRTHKTLGAVAAGIIALLFVVFAFAVGLRDYPLIVLPKMKGGT